MLVEIEMSKFEFDNFLKLKYLKLNKRILFYCKNEFVLNDFKELFLDLGLTLIYGEKFEDSNPAQLICTRKFIGDPNTDLVVIVGPISSEHFYFYEKNFPLIAMPSRESPLCYRNENYWQMIYFDRKY